MNRNEFVGEGKIERIKDPAIQPKQRWKAVNKHDFGNGPVDYYIYIAFKDPMSNLWICNYGWAGNNLMFNQASMYVAKLSTEDITKNFEIDNTPAPQQIDINQPIPIPNQWVQPFQNPGVIYRQGFGGAGDGFITTNTFTTSSAGGAGANTIGGSGGVSGYAVNGVLHGDGMAQVAASNGIAFNFADHIHNLVPQAASPIM